MSWRPAFGASGLLESQDAIYTVNTLLVSLILPWPQRVHILPEPWRRSFPGQPIQGVDDPLATKQAPVHKFIVV
jgi:hypothetical protein